MPRRIPALFLTVAGHAVLCACLCMAGPLTISSGTSSSEVTVSLLHDMPPANRLAPPKVHLQKVLATDARAPVIPVSPPPVQVAALKGENSITLKPRKTQKSLTDTEYPARVSMALAAVKRYPFTERMAHHQGAVWLLLRIAGDGRLTDVQLQKPSGYPALDQTALDMARNATPFPPVPTGKPVEISVPVTFFLDN